MPGCGDCRASGAVSRNHGAERCAARSRMRVLRLWRLPEVDPALDGEAVDRGELVWVESEVVQGGGVLLELLDTARAEKCRGAALIPQDPRARHLSQVLATLLRDPCQAAKAIEVLLGEEVLREVVPRAHAGVLRDPVQIAICQQALGERREHDRSDTLPAEDIQ